MNVGVKKLLRAGMVPARTWGVHAVGCQEADDSSRGTKRAQPRCPCSWKHLAMKCKKSSLQWLLRLGQMERGLVNGTQNKKHIDEADF